ncbi:carbohydrate kinase [uncultured Winogradskyella sp.]|uniref:carbohydrate kinase family protein n=1 Tax=uncultured Winogradskyella sp. TaxID=395353 RepID=UPI002618E6C0|nr:carbohydrate kinase [uncultured Winogradskyella sp.]
MSNIVCFGEILWDVFPTHKKIGGAPLNVALRLRSFGNEVTIISSVGNDKDGSELIKFIKEKGILYKEVQVSDTYKTGCVKVALDNNGSATYDIEFPCAWDYIELHKSSVDIVKNSDAFIYGSLICRNDMSKSTLQELLKFARFKVFDINLRVPHYNMTQLEELMNDADFIKFNDEELIEICEHLNYKYEDIEDAIRFIAKTTRTNNICVTLGGDGALLFKDDNIFKSLGYKVTVKDTVGAGDSFLATLINKLLSNIHPQESLEYACAIGALVASKDGANPNIKTVEVKSLMG